MKENYIYDMLVQFLYRELSADDTLFITQLIDRSPDVRLMYQELRQAKMSLPKVQFNPSTQALSNILQYSTKTALEAQH